MNKKKVTYYYLTGLIFFVLSILIRYRIRGLTNIDTDIIGGWYQFLYENGYKGLSSATFSNYPPAYLYFLWFSTLLSKLVGRLVSIKLIPTFFDFISAIAIYAIANTKYKKDLSFTITGLYFLLPTVMMNSSGWGQIDSLYTSFLLLSFYFILTKKTTVAMFALGVAFSFKAQAIFFLPLIGLLILWGQIKWYKVIIIPLIYLISAVPTVWLGRSWQSVINLYIGQVSQFEEIAKTAPNLYIFIPLKYYHPFLEIGLTVFLVSMLAWGWVNWKSKPVLSHPQLALTALASVSLVPFLLPKMHDRYFYPADVFSYVAAVIIPDLWFVPVLFQVSSGFAYTIFLFSWDPIFVYTAAILNTWLVTYIAYRQILLLQYNQTT